MSQARSRAPLSNLEEPQVFWTVSRPGRYHRVRLTADAAVEATAPVGTCAVLSHSGGMDATSSMLPQSFADLGRRRRAIVAAALVHGLDLHLLQKTEIERTLRRALGTHSHTRTQKVAVIAGLHEIKDRRWVC